MLRELVRLLRERLEIQEGLIENYRDEAMMTRKWSGLQ